MSVIADSSLSTKNYGGVNNYSATPRSTFSTVDAETRPLPIVRKKGLS